MIDKEKKYLNNNSKNIFSELKKLIYDSNIFRNNTKIDKPEFGVHFIGDNITIRWYEVLTDFTLYLRDINEKLIFYSPFDRSKSNLDFENLNIESNYENLKINDLEKIFLDKLNEFVKNQVLYIKGIIIAENENLNKKKKELIIELDKDNDGEIDLVENDFYKLMIKNQKKIIDFDKKILHQFIKISNFIKTKKLNTQKIFHNITITKTHEDFFETSNLLKNQIYSYELLVFHSLNMIGALLSENLITFYEIYESFDKLGIFNSNWENEVSEKLSNIGNKLDDLMYSIYNMEQNIINELNNLTYLTQESFHDLNTSITNQLLEVESSINTNNLLNSIQVYQLYKLNVFSTKRN